MSTINLTAHGLTAGTRVAFFDIVPDGTGLDPELVYYVLADGLTADAFQISETVDGAPLTLLLNVTSAELQVVPDEDAPELSIADYEPVLDPEDVQAPPDTRHVTHTWPDAPGQPQNFLVATAYKGLGARWDATSVGDLMFYEFRYAPDDGTGLAPNTELWTKHQVKTSVVIINDLLIGQLYWCQVRSVDFNGQVVTSAMDATVQDYLAAPEAGWTDALSVIPTAVPQGDVAFNSVLANIVSTNALDASTIRSGLLSIDTTDANLSDGIRIYDSGILIGFWDETGLYIGDAVMGIPVNEDNSIGDLTSTSWLKVYDAGITVFSEPDGVTLELADYTGINASAITWGMLPGGPNIVKNGSFEMSAFVAAPSTKTWDVTADFTGTEVSSTNVTNSNAITSSASGTYS